MLIVFKEDSVSFSMHENLFLGSMSILFRIQHQNKFENYDYVNNNPNPNPVYKEHLH